MCPLARRPRNGIEQPIARAVFACHRTTCTTWSASRGPRHALPCASVVAEHEHVDRRLFVDAVLLAEQIVIEPAKLELARLDRDWRPELAAT